MKFEMLLFKNEESIIIESYGSGQSNMLVKIEQKEMKTLTIKPRRS